MTKPSVLIYAPFFKPGYKGGGPIKSLYNIASECAEAFSFEIVTLEHDLGDNKPYSGIISGDWNRYENTSVKYVSSKFYKIFSLLSPVLSRKFDILYLNSFFSMKFSLFPLLLARLLRQKVLLAPRGEFSEGALQLKYLRKGIFIRLLRLLGVYNSVSFHATSEQERNDIMRIFPRAKVFVAENIVVNESLSLSIPRKSKGLLNLVFVSRISEKKNLLYAINILRDICNIKVKFDIYGPLEDRLYWQTCKLAIESLPDNISVVYCGELQPDDVAVTMNSYDAFLFPTYGENYGHAIVESMLVGLPLIISDQTPWTDLAVKGIGWDLALSDCKGFQNAIYELADMDVDSYFNKRLFIKKWAENEFFSTRAVDETINLFLFSLDRG